MNLLLNSPGGSQVELLILVIVTFDLVISEKVYFRRRIDEDFFKKIKVKERIF